MSYHSMTEQYFNKEFNKLLYKIEESNDQFIFTGAYNSIIIIIMMCILSGFFFVMAGRGGQSRKVILVVCKQLSVLWMTRLCISCLFF